MSRSRALSAAGLMAALLLTVSCSRTSNAEVSESQWREFQAGAVRLQLPATYVALDFSPQQVLHTMDLVSALGPAFVVEAAAAAEAKRGRDNNPQRELLLWLVDSASPSRVTTSVVIFRVEPEMPLVVEGWPFSLKSRAVETGSVLLGQSEAGETTFDLLNGIGFVVGKEVLYTVKEPGHEGMLEWEIPRYHVYYITESGQFQARRPTFERSIGTLAIDG